MANVPALQPCASGNKITGDILPSLSFFNMFRLLDFESVLTFISNKIDSTIKGEKILKNVQGGQPGLTPLPPLASSRG